MLLLSFSQFYFLITTPITSSTFSTIIFSVSHVIATFFYASFFVVALVSCSSVACLPLAFAPRWGLGTALTKAASLAGETGLAAAVLPSRLEHWGPGLRAGLAVFLGP